MSADGAQNTALRMSRIWNCSRIGSAAVVPGIAAGPKLTHGLGLALKTAFKLAASSTGISAIIKDGYVFRVRALSLEFAASTVLFTVRNSYDVRLKKIQRVLECNHQQSVFLKEFAVTVEPLEGFY